MKRLREKIFEPTYMLFGHWILLEVKIWIELPGTRLIAWYYELGGMKPGPRSFSRLLFTCDEWSRIRHHSPELLRMSVWRKVRKDWFDERSRETDWFWFGHALFFMVRYIRQDGKMCGPGKHGVLLRMAPSILSNFSHTFYAYMFHRIEYFTLFFLFQVNHDKIFSSFFLWGCGNKNGFLSIQISCIYAFNTLVIVESRSNGWEIT